MMARLRGMTAALAVGIVLAVAAACTAGAYLYSRRHYERLLDGARATALAQAELIRTALEHEMLTQDRTLIARMARSFGSEPGVTGVMLLDRTGVVRYSRFTLTATAPIATTVLAFPRGVLMHFCSVQARVGYVLALNIAAVIGRRHHVLQAMWLSEMQRAVNNAHA
jgi:hypothetical protein